MVLLCMLLALPCLTLYLTKCDGLLDRLEFRPGVTVLLPGSLLTDCVLDFTGVLGLRFLLENTGGSSMKESTCSVLNCTVGMIEGMEVEEGGRRVDSDDKEFLLVVPGGTCGSLGMLSDSNCCPCSVEWYELEGIFPISVGEHCLQQQWGVSFGLMG